LVVGSGCLFRSSDLYARQKNDRIDALNRLAAQYLYKQLDTCFTYLSAARETARETGYKKGEAQAYRTLGAYYAYRDNSYLSSVFIWMHSGSMNYWATAPVSAS
jgi:hypothetical protein